MTSTWLVIACPGSRTDELERCLGSLRHDPRRTVIVTTAHDRVDALPVPANVAVDHSEDFSLARLWNMGLDWAYTEGATEVAVFASDVVGHTGSIPALAALMRANGLTMAGPAWYTGSLVLHSDRTTELRVPGGCFMVAAEHRLRCDERYRWWFSDDDLELQARAVGPVGIFTGTGLVLSKPDAGLDTDDKTRWAAEDRAYFGEKWGGPPW